MWFLVSRGLLNGNAPIRPVSAQTTEYLCKEGFFHIKGRKEEDLGNWAKRLAV